ncbi:urea amidolyase associated protein UAAP2 [uncultured Ellagibacter sp.]|uniref:urea amidolyase associated protein UAAP2 n=1 Tax=uncultured Ellagibacter sp. TaxID=2137580 RepID=UPI0026147E09|nr:urea amidolyase associated protein UAAP2 [uncultured Ellagibacter sp.]
MYGLNAKESTLNPEDAIYDEVVGSGCGWSHELLPGQTLRILDIEGNQAVDTTFMNLDDPADHYSATATIVGQKNIYLTTGTILRSEQYKPLLEITADLTGRHDTLGGCCSAQSNTVRYAREKEYMANCRDDFMLEMSKDPEAQFLKRDLAPNINFFMNVPITEDGYYKFDDGVSAPGKYVEMRAIGHVMVFVSNCPQLNNPCNAYNPTPVRMLIWDAE